MHKVLLFLCGLLWAGVLCAAPVSNLKKTVVQPDGSKLELLLSGNEYSHRLHDAENYSVIRGKDGYYYYAINDADGNVVPSVYRYGSVKPAQVGISKGINISAERLQERWEMMHANRPPEVALLDAGEPLHLGKMHNVVVFVRFADDEEFETPRKDFDVRFNGGDGVESLKSFYEEVSCGKFTIETALFPECDPEKNISYQDTAKREAFENRPGMDPIELALLRRVVKQCAADVEKHYTREQLDKNGDGKVDNITFVIRGETGEWNTVLWPHKGWMSANEDVAVRIHGLLVQDFILQPEVSVSVYTSCHEMFHGLGGPDLYVYDQSISYGPVGGWDLMGGGFVHMSAYLKWKYTNHLWVEDIPEITKSGRYGLKPLAKGNQNVAYRISVGGENEARQWLVFEFRKRVGAYEKNLPGSGLVVSRVMPDMSGSDNAPWEVYLYRPGGTDLVTGDLPQAFLSKESGRTHWGNDTDPQLFLAANSNRLKSGLAYVDISDVSEAKSDEIFFTVTLPTPAMDTIRLKPGGTGDGSSWANAAGDLEKAIEQMYYRKRGEIWLAGGSWQFTDDTLRLREYTNIYGGFAGTETSKEERRLIDRNGDGKTDPWEFEAVSKLEFSGKSLMEVERDIAKPKPVYCEGVTISGLTGSIVVPRRGVFSRMEICNNAPALEQNGFIQVMDNAVFEKSYLHHNDGEGHLIYQRGGVVRNCVITNNHSSKASLLSLGVRGGLRNCLVANNETDANPGITVDHSFPDILNNTFVHNKTQNTTGWIVADTKAAKIQMYNTILWGNMSAGLPEVDPASVYILESCAIQGYKAEDYANKPDEVKDNICLAENNQGSETGKYYPQFKQVSSDRGWSAEGYKGADWSCEGNSPCIDGGTEDKKAEEGVPDLAGNLRVMNGKVDVGAYEHLVPVAATIELKDLTQVYTGEALQPSVTTSPEGLNVKITYNGTEELPVNGGTYAVVAEVTDPSYTASRTAEFKIEKAEQTISFEELPDAYVGEVRVLHAVSSSGLPVVFAVSDAAAEIQKDTVVVFKQVVDGLAVTATCAGNENYKEISVLRSLNVRQTRVTVSLEGLLADYDQEPHPVQVQVTPEVSYEVTYNGGAEVPVNAGKYAVKAIVNAPGYAGYCIDTLVIAKAKVTLEMSTDSVVFNETEQWPELKNVPSGVNVVKTANGKEEAPYHAGSYQIEVTVDDPNYEGSLQKEYVIKRMPVEIVFDESSLTQVFSAGSKEARVTTVPDGHEIDIVYEFKDNHGSLGKPYWAGKYDVTVGVDEVDYYASPMTREMVVERAPVSITLDRSALEHTYNGEAVRVAAVSPIADLQYGVYYNGSITPPVDGGDYEVIAVVEDVRRYQGSDTVTLHIGQAAQQIEFDQLTEIEMEISYLPLKAVASSGLTVEYESSAPEVASVNKKQLLLHQGGTTVVTARQSGDRNYLAADPVSLTFTLLKRSQEIIWEQEFPDMSLATEPIGLSAEASSGLAVEYASDNEAVAVVEDGMLRVKGPGTAVITASQGGNGFYNAATSVSKTVTVINGATEIEALDLIVADGSHNQKFKIKDVEFLNDNHLIVFNKAGGVVYSRDNYDNSFDMGQVPAGTYYYVFTYLNVNGNKQTKKGFVEVVRN